MKIVHVSISDPFIDDWGYQVNLLSRYLQYVGIQNYVVASANDFPAYLSAEVIKSIKAKGCHYELDGVIIRRIQTRKISNSFIYTKHLKQTLDEIQPNVIFHHNFNCTSMLVSAKYAKKHKIPMIVDNHADIINMSKNKFWVWFYYKLLIGLSCKVYRKQIYKAYGVTHSRCEFIHEYYGLPYEKIDFLPIGADVIHANSIRPTLELRNQYGFLKTDFIVVTGGKMGIEKGTNNLICAVEELHEQYPQLRLILFGKFEDNETFCQANESKVTIVYDWCDRTKTLELLKLADVACWPIHHTTLIEDAVAVCTPIINRKTGTSEHLIDGNGIWIKTGAKEELKDALWQMLKMNEERRSQMALACESMKKRISYQNIANKLLNDISKTL